MSSNNLYKKAENYVKQLFDEYPHPNLLFHNLEHTEKVVARTQEIAAHYQLTDQETLVVYIAAWFHDTGHLFAEIEKHEDKSVEIMRIFMQQENAEEDITKSIEDCIMATRMPHEPKNLLQEILCDADTYHFWYKRF